MKSINQKKYFAIPPSWPVVFAMIGAFCFFFYRHITGYESILPKNSYPIIECIFFSIAIPLVSTSYVLNDKELTVKLLFLPLRKISWHRIQQVMLFEKWYYKGIARNDSVIIISLWGCEPFIQGVHEVVSYTSAHPIDTIKIRIPIGKLEEYANAFEEFYGTITRFDIA